MTKSTMPMAGSLNEVLALYEQWGHDNYDEDISQLDHALQTAALAVHDGANDDLVVAALLHDVGHLLDLSRGNTRTALRETDLAHESAGARFLTLLFPPSVTGPIALHVRAKRYLCASVDGYHDGLSNGSRASLALQGGPMTPAEVSVFEQNPGYDDAVRLREWDDGGKIEHLEVAPFEAYLALLERVISG